AGPWAGRLAVALLACEPSLLGHASLATTDIAVAACLLAFVYHFQAGRDACWRWRIGVPALWFAAALLAQASALVFAPMCMLAVELAASRSKTSTGTTGFRWRDSICIASAGVFLAFVYCGSDWQPQSSFVTWAHRLPSGTAQSAMVWLAEHLCIFPNAGS